MNAIFTSDKLASEINELDKQLNEAVLETLLIAVEMGEKLIQAKESLLHGEFQSWIESYCTVKYRQAAKYMRLAKHWTELSKVHSNALLELGIDEALSLLAKPKRIEIHEICQVFPWLPEDEMVEFVASIKAVGLLKPITLFQGKILDGKIRYRACLEANVTPVFEEYEGDDPVGFVTSKNLYRAHISKPVRSAVTNQ